MKAGGINGTVHDALAPYSWSCSVNWCLANVMEIYRCAAYGPYGSGSALRFYVLCQSASLGVRMNEMLYGNRNANRNHQFVLVK